MGRLWRNEGTTSVDRTPDGEKGHGDRGATDASSSETQSRPKQERHDGQNGKDDRRRRDQTEIAKDGETNK